MGTGAVSAAMYRQPTCARHGEDRSSLLATMRRLSLHQLPILDAEGRVVGLALVDELLATPPRDNPVVIMAGGLGSRLQELTRDTPKPMLKVGSRPLLETIVRGFAEQGFTRSARTTSPATVASATARRWASTCSTFASASAWAPQVR